MWQFLILFLVILAIVFFIGLALWGIKKALLLSLNSVVGFFALYALKAYLLPMFVINWISIIFVALFGIFGFAAVLILHGFGLWF